MLWVQSGRGTSQATSTVQTTRPAKHAPAHEHSLNELNAVCWIGSTGNYALAQYSALGGNLYFLARDRHGNQLDPRVQEPERPGLESLGRQGLCLPVRPRVPTGDPADRSPQRTGLLRGADRPAQLDYQRREDDPAADQRTALRGVRPRSPAPLDAWILSPTRHHDSRLERCDRFLGCGGATRSPALGGGTRGSPASAATCRSTSVHPGRALRTRLP